MSYYKARVPILANGAQATLLASSFDAVRDAVKRGWRLDVDGEPASLPLDLTRLFEWARTERLLVGQRSRILDEGIAEARNHAAHPVNYSATMPVEVARTLSDATEIVNKLWGADTPGGRLFPGPVARVPQAVALSRDGASSVEFQSLHGIREDDPKYRDWSYTVYLAGEDEELVRLRGGGPRPTYQPGFQTTLYPCELLWGPGPQDELVSQIDHLEDDALCDAVEYLDRVFAIRVDGDKPDDARSPEDFYASAETQGVWYVIRADHPWTRGVMPAITARSRQVT